MGSSMMQPDPQQMMMQAQMQPQMPTSMPPGGGMMMPGPMQGQPPMGGGGPPMGQQMGGGNMSQMGMGGKGDMNPLMMLFPGIGRRMREQQMQQWQMGMAERQQRDAERVTNFNLQQHQAQATEESGEREAIGREVAYIGEHPESTKDLQGLVRSIKQANPNVDPKMLGPVLQAVMPLMKEQDQVAIKQAAQAQKEEEIGIKQQGVDIREQKLGIDRLEHERKVTKDEATRQQKDRALNQADRKYDQIDKKIQIEYAKAAEAKAKGDQQALHQHRQEITALINGGHTEAMQWAASENISDDESKKAVQDRIEQNTAIRMHALGEVLGQESATPSPQQGDAPSTPSPESSGLLDEAKAAIAAGAPKDAVIKRLKEKGIDASGL